MQFDCSKISSNNCYKLIASTVVPRPIAWVVTQAADGVLNAAPYSFFNAVSGEPPIVALGVGGRTEGGPKDTNGNIRRSGQFVVNLVSDELAQAMNMTAVEFDADVDEIAEAGLTTAPSVLVGPPRIAESPVALECEVFQIVALPNDRDIILGRVLMVHVRDDCVLDAARCYIDTPKLGLVGRMHGGGWYARTTDRFEMPRIPLAAVRKAAE